MQLQTKVNVPMFTIICIIILGSLTNSFHNFNKKIDEQENENDKLIIDLRQQKIKNSELEDQVFNLNGILHKQQETINNNEKVIKELQEENQKLNNNIKENEKNKRKLKMTITHYDANCIEGCTGISATGIDLRNSIYYEGFRVIATDPNVIPLYSIVKIEFENGESIEAISLDTGGAIVNNKVDLLVQNNNVARQQGVRQATVTVLREGKGSE